MKIFDLTRDKKVFAEVPIPNDLIICDSCNTRIDSEKVALLIEVSENSYHHSVRQALCERCREKYFPNHICIGEPSNEDEKNFNEGNEKCQK